MDFSSLRNLRRLCVRESLRNCFPSLPSGIRHFDFGGCFSDRQFNGESEENIRNANLTELSTLLLPSASIDWSSFQALLKPCKGNIQILNLRAFRQSRLDGGIPELLLDRDHLKSLVELDVSINELKDDFFEHIAKSCPRLRNLDASCNNMMTGVGVKELIMKPGDKLKKMDLRLCSRVGIDAVEFARANGVEVNYCFPDVQEAAKKRAMAHCA